MKRLTFGFLCVSILVAVSCVPVFAQLPTVRISSFDKPSFGHTTASLIEAKAFDKKNGIDIQWVFKNGRAVNVDFAAGRDKITIGSALLSEALSRPGQTRPRAL